MIDESAIGKGATRDWLVDEALTVRAHGTVDLPVLATPNLIFMLEDTCVAAAKPLLDDGELTVGTAVYVDHLAAAPVGTQIHANVRIVAIRPKRLVFRVEATAGPSVVARGVHERAIVKKLELERRLQK
ncbi:MAG: thioesterase family protein [Variibacter sp.]